MTKIMRVQANFLAVSLLLLLFLLSACGVPLLGNTVSLPTPTPTPKPKDPTTLLNDTQKAMQALKSEHQLITMTAGGGSLSALTQSSNTQSNSSVDMSKASFSMKIDSDIQQPDQSATSLYMHIAIGTMDVTYNLKEVTKDKRAYIQNAKGTWYVLDQQDAGNPTTNPFASFSTFANFKDMASSFLKGKVTDHSYETVNGLRLRHLTSTLNQGNAAKALGSSSQLNSLTTATVDIWIDEATSYTHRIDFKATLTPPKGANTLATAGASSVIEVSIDYSNLNKPVKITAPTGAIPAKSFADALI